MDEIYIRSRHEPPQGPQPETAPKNNDDRANGAANGTANGNARLNTNGSATNPKTTRAVNQRQWKVSVRLNENDSRRRTIVDPFLESEYESVFENYLRDSDRPRWSPASLTAEADGDGYEYTRTEDRIQAYGEELFDQLQLDPDSFTLGSAECQVYVIDHHQSGASGPDIHCLAWELLELVDVPGHPGMRLRVTRISDSATHPPRPYRILQPLAVVQADPGLTFRILLVIARDFSRIGAERDPEPDLAQWPLMSLLKKSKNRLQLEIVRPGSVEELREHLRLRDRQGVRFHLVHFDLHGRITEDSHGRQSPCLLFARHNATARTNGYQVPQTQLAKADVVAELLAEYKVENVVLNACLSAYNRSGPGTNLAHIFLRHGIRRVSAMWFYVHWQTVSTYVETFYNELLVKGTDFNRAAHKGREAVRLKPTSRIGQVYQDFFLCVNYASEVQKQESRQRDPSPSPSVRSQDSSTSNASGKSFKSGLWKPPTPRLGDGFPSFSDEPIMRLKLHFLELEYKLMVSRIVYASDLRRADSKLAVNVEKLVNMWLATNLIDDVFYYKGKDFAKRRVLKESVASREKRSRASNGGYLQLLFPRPIRALRSSLHIVRELDAIVDPGMQADDLLNQRSEERRMTAQENLQRFAQKLMNDDDGSYLLILGSNDAQWWRTYLQHLGGEWWVHMPWGFTLHSRHRDVRFPGQGIGAGVTLLGTLS